MNRGRGVGIVLAALTSAALWWAGSAGTVTTEQPRASSPQTAPRVFGCVTGLPGGGAVAGTLLEGGTDSAAGFATTRPLRRGAADLSAGGRGFVVRAQGPASASAYATQWASTRSWYAAQACPEAARQQWFLGAGGSRLHRSRLVLMNSRAAEAVVDVRVFGQRGELQVPGLRGLSVRGEPLELDLTEVAPSLDDLAVSVTAVRGLVSASMVDRWAPSATARMSTDFLPAAAEPATDLLLGPLPDEARKPTVSVLNTGDSAAVLETRLISGDGTFEVTGSKTRTIAPGRVIRIPVPTARQGRASGLRITSSEPILAAVRALVGRDVVHAGSLSPLGDSAVVGLPVQARARLHLYHPGTSGAIRAAVSLHDTDGRRIRVRRVLVAPGTSRTLDLSLRRADVASIRITGAGDLRGAVEVTRDGGSASIGIRSLSGQTRVPAVLPHG